MPVNVLDISILPDGRIRIETGSFKGPQHAVAETFLRVLLEELGVAVDAKTPLTVSHQGAKSVIIAGSGSGR